MDCDADNVNKALPLIEVSEFDFSVKIIWSADIEKLVAEEMMEGILLSLKSNNTYPEPSVWDGYDKLKCPLIEVILLLLRLISCSQDQVRLAASTDVIALPCRLTAFR